MNEMGSDAQDKKRRIDDFKCLVRTTFHQNSDLKCLIIWAVEAIRVISDAAANETSPSLFSEWISNKRNIIHIVLLRATIYDSGRINAALREIILVKKETLNDSLRIRLKLPNEDTTYSPFDKDLRYIPKVFLISQRYENIPSHCKRDLFGHKDGNWWKAKTWTCVSTFSSDNLENLSTLLKARIVDVPWKKTETTSKWDWALLLFCLFVNALFSLWTKTYINRKILSDERRRVDRRRSQNRSWCHHRPTNNSYKDSETAAPVNQHSEPFPLAF